MGDSEDRDRAENEEERGGTGGSDGIRIVRQKALVAHSRAFLDDKTIDG